MGWLKDASREAGVGSLEALARALKAAGAPGLRGREVANARSFANLLRACDGGAELPPRLEAAVAEALGLRADDLRQRHRPDIAVRAVRAPHDALPPGYSMRVLEPRRWSREWWDVRDHLAAEPRVVIDWVVAQHPYVQVVSARTLADAIVELPERGAAVVFVSETRGDERRLELPSHCALLVVAWHALSRATDDEPSPWRQVGSEPVDCAAVLAWFQGRGQPGFDVARAVELLETPRFAAARRTPGRVLALGQAIVELGLETLRTHVGTRLLAASLAKPDARVRALGPHPERVIVGLLERLALRDVGMNAPFPVELLEPLVPPLDTALLRAASLDARVSDAELGRRLREALAPSGHKLAEALTALGWLTAGSGGWRLDAHWLVPELVSELAARWSASGDERALVAPEVAPLVIERLHARMAAGDLAPLDEAIAALDLARPRSLVRLEACLRAAGLAALEPRDGAWQARVIEAFALYADARKGFAAADGPLHACLAPGWLSLEVWGLALGALARVVTSEPLSASQQRRLARLAHSAAAQMRGIPTIVDAISAFVERHCPDEPTP